MNPDLGDNARFLASIERIIDSLFNRRQESLPRIIEAKQVPVLREEFADGYVALFCRHRLGRGGAALWLFTCFVDVGHICVLFHLAGGTLVIVAGGLWECFHWRAYADESGVAHHVESFGDRGTTDNATRGRRCPTGLSPHPRAL